MEEAVLCVQVVMVLEKFPINIIIKNSIIKADYFSNTEVIFSAVFYSVNAKI